MLTLGKGLGILLVFFVAWCILYPVLSALGVERFRWNRYSGGGAIVVFMGAVFYGWMMIRIRLRFFGSGNEPDGQSGGLKADFLEGVRMGLIAVLICTVLGVAMVWYTST